MKQGLCVTWSPAWAPKNTGVTEAILGHADITLSGLQADVRNYRSMYSRWRQVEGPLPCHHTIAMKDDESVLKASRHSWASTQPIAGWRRHADFLLQFLRKLWLICRQRQFTYAVPHLSLKPSSFPVTSQSAAAISCHPRRFSCRYHRFPLIAPQIPGLVCLTSAFRALPTCGLFCLLLI